MASLTVRQLDERLKKLLRMRAARHGRSMEDEVRTILGAAAEEAGHEASELINSPAPKGAPQPAATSAPRVLLIIGGGIAAYKSLELIRRLKERGVALRCILTRAATEFVTPLAAGALAGGHVFTDLFDPKSEFDVGHIRLARDADLVVVAPATADLMAKMANGHADDLATAVLLATSAKILLAPAMNPHMWANAATQRNLQRLVADGATVVGPNEGEMAEAGERGRGRMSEPTEIAEAAIRLLRPTAQPLKDKRVLITSGPTHEPIDPVRYIANRSSGKQGHAIAAAAAAAGAHVTLVSGPVTIPDPRGVTVVHVESARDMLKAVEDALPTDVAIFAAAVADWRVVNTGAQKIKKKPGAATPELTLTENPDILSTVAHRKTGRPPLVIGFAAETENVVANARDKLARKGCDWILANDVSPATGIMGGDMNTIQFVQASGTESWPPQSKEDVARMLVDRIATAMGETAP
ncbi:MAG TPA: bifunctional phosphopantothenoylcysteine decarboxylase/phosphopantothenate--cysteine ligase CoaBC [Pseudolabrys sp.]|uniref:bifunctional phosphopantothenoylcysteine decarboxylase/phosphopantothenate--cysteine ligase CoaBC n=1 Tax=Pseudolabrys sp. TaxID=1960880 RepID=UPI002DDCE45B|nr:bifunctional phosphopantothenoylcysteine decarboxylase/phosphopantothenate--cysteine ligase CoaBC [Pseudolabrys sp.]HEV2627957.1 bifunctional phosphopantothenoylcysteine decarboxylase/phosphopantothenate--cysteine ligase CoaBC [Pseudolabrys sp.]